MDLPATIIIENIQDRENVHLSKYSFNFRKNKNLYINNIGGYNETIL